MKDKIKIINKSSKEIKLINKKLKKEKLAPLIIGNEALEQCYLSEKNILLLDNLQELSGLNFVFNTKAFIRKDTLGLKNQEFALIAGYPVNLPLGAYQSFDTKSIKNSVKEKYFLMIHALQLFDFYQKNAQKIKKKNRTISEQIHLNVQIKDLYEAYAQTRAQTMTPFSLHHQAINIIGVKKGLILDNPLVKAFNLPDYHKIDFAPWLIINKNKNGYEIIYGKNQKQLIAYLQISDYLQKYQIEYYFSIDFIHGWEKVLEKQNDLGQVILPSLTQELIKFHQNPILQQQLIKKAHLLDDEITTNFQKMQVLKSETIKQLEQIKEIKSEIAKQQFYFEGVKYEALREKEHAQKIKIELIKEQAQFEDIRTQTFREIALEKESIKEAKRAICQAQEELVMIKTENKKNYRMFESTAQYRAVNETNNSDEEVKPYDARELKYFSEVQSYVSANAHTLSEMAQEVKERIINLEQKLSGYSPLNKKETHPFFYEIMSDIGEIIQSYSVHHQKISSILLKEYIQHMNNVAGNEQAYSLVGHQGKIISILVEHFEAHELKFCESIWQAYLVYVEKQIQLLLSNESAERDVNEVNNIVNQLTKLSAKSITLDRWLLRQRTLINEFKKLLKSKRESSLYVTFYRVMFVLKKIFKPRKSKDFVEID